LTSEGALAAYSKVLARKSVMVNRLQDSSKPQNHFPSHLSKLKINYFNMYYSTFCTQALTGVDVS
jgi:hypothetical protein